MIRFTELLHGHKYKTGRSEHREPVENFHFAGVIHPPLTIVIHIRYSSAAHWMCRSLKDGNDGWRTVRCVLQDPTLDG